MKTFLLLILTFVLGVFYASDRLGPAEEFVKGALVICGAWILGLTVIEIKRRFSK